MSADRVRALVSWARQTRPAVALSHNSYAQIVAARALGIRTVTAMDYEHQPANHLAFRLAHQVLLPAVLATTGIRGMGATRRKTRFYSGLKEELYLGDFRPDREVLVKLGIERGDGQVVIVARTPPSGALYHRAENPLFAEVLRAACRESRVRCVALARRPEQRRSLGALGLENLVIPDRTVDARSLIHSADLMVGAGGTMTREAALLGVPTVSVFTGRPAAVDGWLERHGQLRRVRRPEELTGVQPRAKEPHDPTELRSKSERLIGEWAAAVIQPPAATGDEAVLAAAHD